MDRTERLARLADARLYLICGTREADRPLADILRPALAGGVDVFQLRDKHAPESELRAAAEVARALCAEAGALLFVNDSPELAVAAGADGVHVGQDDMTLEEARARGGEQLLVGRSTHSPPQVDGAGAADLIGVGPVHPTPTKRWRPAVGLDLVRYAAAHASLPWFAIGGMDATTIPAAVAAGATRVAVVRAIAEAPDPRDAAYRLRSMLPEPMASRGSAQPAT